MHVPLYRIWRAILNRCYNPHHTHYKYYGARGIGICPEWLDAESGFDSFYVWSIENGYAPGLTIDRINADDGYSPSNCRWVTNKAQQNNKRNNIFLTYDGETHTMQEWSEILDVPYAKIRYHIRVKNRSLSDFINNYI